MIKLFKPQVSWWTIWEVLKTLRSGQLAEGPRVKKFEEEFAKKFNLNNVVAVNSGSSALELAYELAGIKEGDEVITTVLTCTATNLPLVRRKAKIVFADIDPDLNISVEDVKKKITKRTRAIVFVHFGGNNRGLSEIQELAKQKGLIVIEDAAQAVGTENFGKSDFVAVSLQAIKTITSGDGGFFICKDKEKAEIAKRLRWFGIDRPKKQKEGDIDVTEAGYKYHMNDVSAAIGLGNMKKIDKWIKHRKEIAKIYESYGLNAHIWMTSGIFKDNWQVLKEIYAKNGVEIGQHHYRNDKYTVFGGRVKGLTVMDAIEKKYFFVPMVVSKRQAHKIGQIYAWMQNNCD